MPEAGQVTDGSSGEQGGQDQEPKRKQIHMEVQKEPQGKGQQEQAFRGAEEGLSVQEVAGKSGEKPRGT